MQIDLDSTTAPQKKGKSYLFGIGINEYLQFSNLSNAVRDVKDFQALLEAKYDLDESITLFDEQATRDQIIYKLDQLSNQLQEADKLIIYYSGHGHLNAKQRGFWIPHDAVRNSTSRYISNSRIKDYLKDISAKHALLISDACFSGSLFVQRNAAIGAKKLLLRKSRWAFCSGRHDEEVVDGPIGGNSPFAESILDILRANEEPYLTIARLADQVIVEIGSNYEQLPEGSPVYGVGHRGGQYVFMLKNARPLEQYEKNRREELITSVVAVDEPEQRSFLQRFGVFLYGVIAVVIGVLLSTLIVYPGKITGTEENLKLPVVNPTDSSALDELEKVFVDSTDLKALADQRKKYELIPTKTNAEKEIPSKKTVTDGEKTNPPPKKKENESKSLRSFEDANEFDAFSGVAVQGLICAKYKGKWGYVRRANTGFKEVIRFQYDYAETFQYKLALVKKGNYFGWIDQTGKTRVPFRYLEVGKAFGTSDNIYKGARVLSSGGWGIINETGKNILPFAYTKIGPFDEDDIAIVRQGDRAGFVNRKGETLFDGLIYEEVEPFQNGRAKVKPLGEDWTIIHN